MIYSLDGIILRKTVDDIVVSCGGVGFLAYVPQSLYGRVGEVGDNVSLFTYMNVKEDGIDLYGFESERCRDTFLMLLSVSGVGPKAALSILSLYEPDAVDSAIAANNYNAFCECSGIGPKIAQRITLELRNKVAKRGTVVSPQGSSPAAEAVSALVALGFTQSEASAAISAMPAGSSSEDMIRHALSQFGSRR